MFHQLLMKFGQIVILMKSGLGLNIGHLGSKARLQGQIQKKNCVDDRGHIFHPPFLKVGQKYG